MEVPMTRSTMVRHPSMGAEKGPDLWEIVSHLLHQVGLSNNMVAGSRGAVRNDCSTASSQSEGISDEDHDSDKEETSRDEISQLAERLEHSPDLAEHLQVINEEDLAAILPDVESAVPVDDAPFDPFEDVSSESAKNGSTAERKSGVSSTCVSSRSANVASNSNTTESGSDVELPAQVVSDAIERIQIDTEGKSTSVGHTENANDDRDDDEEEDTHEGDSSDGGNSRNVYSSSLLQQFVESTERLSGKRASTVPGHWGSKRTSVGGNTHLNKRNARQKRSRLPKSESSRHNVKGSGGLVTVGAGSTDSCAVVVAKSAPPGPAELEVYCSVSNVSPDSGIYCVAGSPWHQSSPAHSPQHTLQQKTLPSPPHLSNALDQHSGKKGLPKAHTSRSKNVRKANRSCTLELQRDLRVPPIHPANESEDEVPPPSPLLSAPARRGPGRPKKAPPILEPCLPLQTKSIQRASHSGDHNRTKGTKGRKKESVSSDRSLERCDKLWKYLPSGKSRSRGVKVTSQGVQCNQSEFSQPSPRKQKKKKRNSMSQSRQGRQGKSVDNLQGSVFREDVKLHQTICDRLNKRLEVPEGVGGPLSDATTPSNSVTKRTPSKSVSTLQRHHSTSVSKQKLGTSVEKRKKGRRREQAAQLAAAAAALVANSAALVTKSTTPSSTSSAVGMGLATTTTTTSSQRSSKLPNMSQQRHSGDKVVCTPCGLKPSHHKHKKHRRRKERRPRQHHSNSAQIDPVFLSELERLIVEFQRSCCITRLPHLAGRCGENVKHHLPSIFRVKRIAKKRKGSERSQNSDKESGPETETVPLAGTPAPRDTRDKGSTGGKRRPKKASVETPKGRERLEANNEQRLPLKKRHYHMSATSSNQQSPLTSSPEISPDFTSSLEEKQSDRGSPATSISSKSSIASASTQSVPGSKTSVALTAVSTVNSSSSCKPYVTTTAGKTGMVASVSSLGKAIAASFTSDPNTKDISNTVCNTGSKVITPVCSVPNKVSVLTSTGTVTLKSSVLDTTGKVSVVSPVANVTNRGGIPSISCVTTVASLATVPGIISKANTAASFASICSTTVISETASSSCKETVVSVSNVTDMFPSSTANKNILPPATAVNQVNKPVVTSFSSLAPPKMSPVTTVSSLNSQSKLLPAVSSPSTKPTNADCLAVSAIKATMVTSVIAKTSVITSSTSVASKTSLTNSSPVVSKPGPQPSVITTTNKSSSSSSVNVSGTSNNSKSSGTSSPPKVSLVQKAKSGETNRNSIDEAIEACITRYSCGSQPALPSPLTRSVITTPKKRHRMEMQGKSGMGTGKGKESEVTSVSSTSTHVGKRSNSRTAGASVPLVECQPPEQVTSSGGSKLPESGIFEPSLSSEDFVDLPLPATPIKSVIAVLSKLKSATPPTTPPATEEVVLTSHNLRQKKTNHVLECKVLVCGSKEEADPKIRVVQELKTMVTRQEGMAQASSPALASVPELASASTISVVSESAVVESEVKPVILKDQALPSLIEQLPVPKPVSTMDCPPATGQAPTLVRAQTVEPSSEIKVGIKPNTRPTVQHQQNKMKDVRIHVRKLSSSDLLLQKAIGAANKQRTRRRKCNRTGFPVKRKKKKKACGETCEKAVVISPISTSLITSTSVASVPPEPSEVRTSSRVQNRKDQQTKEKTDPCISKVNPVEEELCDTSKVKMEHRESVAATDMEPSQQSVIVKYEDCSSISSNIKEELQLLDSFDEKSSARSLRAQREEKLHCVARSDDSTMADDEDAGFGMLLKREVTDVADLTRRNAKPKTKLVRTKAGKAVLRAMRAKFAEENTGILSLPSAISKNRRVARCRSQSWSSDSDDYALPSRSARGPEKLLKTVEIEDGAKHDHAKKSTKREMKRHATSLNDGPVKTKCAKSIKDDDSESLASKLKVRVDTEGRFNSMDSRSRGKRKCDGVEDGPSAAELRLARSKKRLRTVQRLEADSVDTDCDESLMEVQLSSALALGDAASEDETPKIGSKDAKQPRWRKKYLPAGLFSEYFKLDEPRPIVDNKKGLLQYKAEDHPHGLLPPPYHCGKWLRQRKINFQLPYDLWWLHTHNRLPGRDLVPSWNYKKIRTNVYTNVKPAYMHEPQACNCRTPETGTDKGCGDDCINRLVYTECVPGLCPLRDLCSNQRIQRHEWAPGLDKFMTKDKGWGVRTKLAIKNGEFILEYVGEVVSDREFKERMATRYTRDTHHYCLHLEGGLVIDGHRMGGDGRFVNHSCEPNCEMQKWCVNGLFRMALFALRDIEPNEELAYDYNFSLFNPAEGQPCKCGSNKCRGVIGGKSQRVNGTPAAQNGSSKAGPSKVSVEDIPERKGSRKNKRKTCRRNDGERVTENMRQRKRIEAQRMSQLLALNIRHMSHQQRSFVQQHHCFLLRNLEKVRRLKERLKQATQRPDGFTRPPPTNVKQSDVFLTQLNALSTPRNVRTRRLAQAEDNPELTRNARLACVLRDLYSAIVAAKDEKGEVLSSPFMTLPNKRKLPLYYERIREPIDFSTVEQNINSGLYRTLEAFDQDVCRILTNNSRFYGRTSQAGIFAVQLRKVYTDAKKEALPQLMDVLGETLPPAFLAEKDPTEDEDVIRCLCGLFRDEGMMIQCERCLVWQHCDCVQADSSIEHYLCEVCQPRPVDLEIKMDPPPSYATEGQINYVTLLRSNLQIRQGDTVYVLRDVTEDGPSQAKVTYKTIKDPKYADMDIFRIERLWKDDKGDRFAFGHHYLRPHETYHEPTRKFYPNEVMRVPLYEIISIDLIWARCWVLDPNTYCKGRPLEAVEEHVYICEYRVDKTAHLFSKISKSCRSTICTKSYAFETFETRLKPVRTYTPHGSVAPLRPKNRGNASSHGDDSSSTKSMPQQPTGGGRVAAGGDEDEDEEVPLARVRASAIAQKAEKRARQQSRLNGILLGMLARLPTKQPLDLSYLLEPNRRPRKKPASLNT